MNKTIILAVACILLAQTVSTLSIGVDIDISKGKTTKRPAATSPPVKCSPCLCGVLETKKQKRRTGDDDNECPVCGPCPPATTTAAPTVTTTTTAPSTAAPPSDNPCNFCPCGTAQNLYQPDGCPICNRCSQSPSPTTTTTAEPTVQTPTCATCPSTPRPSTTTVAPTPVPTLAQCPNCPCGRTNTMSADGCCECAQCPTGTQQPVCPSCACGTTSTVSNGCNVCSKCQANLSGDNNGRAASNAGKICFGLTTFALAIAAAL